MAHILLGELIRELEKERDNYMLKHRNILYYNEGYIAAMDKAIEIIKKRKERAR